MHCAACGHDNPERAKFCLECGAPFAARCASCGVELPQAAKFCLECGTRVGAAPSAPARPAEAPGARTVVTIIFADLVGSTALHERLDAESVRQFMERYYAAMRGAVEAHGGRVTQVMGDGVKAVFGAPRVAEDDAIRAVRAAAAMQTAFRALADEQRGRVGKTGLRVAVNTGEVVSDGESEIIGDPVNVAARLQEQGKDGDVVIGGSTQRIVAALVTLERLGSFALKGRSEQVEAYRIVSLEPPAAAKAAFVGRDEELARLTRVYEQAVAKPATQLAVLLGSPGLGKSRLIDEFVRRLGDEATVFAAHCDASGGGTFAPLAAALRERLGVEDRATPEMLRAALEAALPGEDAERARVVAGVVSLASDAPSSPEETFFVIRRLLAAFAQAKPLVLVIDDLHWAESLLLDLVEHLVQWGSGVPLFVLVGARPELRELRSSLVVPGGFVADVLTLAGLDAGAAMRLAAGVIGAADLPAALAARLLATSEGNPLFVGELVKMLVQEGVLQRDGERWVASAALADLEMPPTIHALLAARIERLRPEERAVLERAAVVGRHFSKNAVAALLSQTSDLDARLEALRRSELIERDTGWFLGEPVLRFHHVLIRDAAYRRVLKGTRAELHARLAGWIEARVGEAAEHDETIGWHLEQAHQHLAELGPLDANGVTLGVRACRRLAAAGRRALARDDVALAASLLTRALACLPREAEERADLALDGCEALLSAGDVANAAGAIDELGRLSEGSPRLGAWHTCFAGQLATLTSPQGLQTTAAAVAAAAAALATLGDAAGEAKAHFVNAQALARLGKVGACEAALDLALAAARRAGDRRRANAVLAGAPRAALWGPSPVTRASGRCLDVVRVLRITQGAPAVEAVALSCQGVLEALRGRTDAAKRMIASARKLVEELGIASRLFEADVFAGRVALLEGDAGGAERSLRGAYEGLRDLGLGIDAAQAAALLARALLAQGRGAEAETLSHESEALAGDDLQAAIAWRGARAEALAQRGEHAAAVELARAAVEIASDTDAFLDHADARLALAAALRAAGRGAEADAEERRARELWEAKGATLLAERAARRTAHAEGAAPLPTVAALAAPPARRRRVRPNAASANAARLDAVVAARDGDALIDLFSDDIRILEHTTGAGFDRAGAIASYRGLITARDPASRHELLATLGESLALFRLRLSASGIRGRSMDVGAYEKDEIHSVEADAAGRRRAGEVWSLSHLGDAVARIYERYAELLPEGPERTRAESVARSISAMASQPDTARRAAVFAPDIEVVDHRTLGTWSARGAESALRHFESIFQVSETPALRDHDILALEPNAVLTLRAHTGVGKESGGAYERRFLNLLVAGADGRLARIEWFDADREAEALARFDELSAAVAPPPVRRRVPDTAATRAAERLHAALAARDPDAFAALHAKRFEVIHHPSGASYGLPEVLKLNRSVWRGENATFTDQPLSALGDSLVLTRRRVTHEGVETRVGSIGPVEVNTANLLEVDERGLVRRSEVFDNERLGSAVVRLYERYAELLPAGPEKIRAAGTARSLAVFFGPIAQERWEDAYAPDVEQVDHRTLASWSARGKAQARVHVRSLMELVSDASIRVDDVLAATPGLVLDRRTHLGTDLASGGRYERAFLALLGMSADGRVVRFEFFDPDREAEALARFGVLAAAAEPQRPGQRRPVRENAATRSFARGEAALAARDPEALAQLFDASLRVVHRPSGVEYGRREMLGTWRGAMQATRFEFRQEMLASLGDTLALDRHVTTVEGLRDATMAGFGHSEVHEISLLEVDADGRWLRSEIFSADRLADGIVSLYERYAELLPEGEERTRAAATARSLAALFGPVDLERWAPALAPSAGIVDHRVLHTWTATNADEYLSQFRHQLALAPDFASRTEDVLDLAPCALLVRQVFFGTAPTGGGAFENDCLVVYSFGRDGLLASVDAFEAEGEAEAFARFDALAAGGAPAPAPRSFENAASRTDARLMHCFNTRDWPGVLACIAPQLVFDERRRMTRNFAEREVWLEQFRLMFDQPASRFTIRLVATRGERLSLHRHEFEAEVAGGGGRLEMEPHYALHEVDSAGRIVAIVLFDLADEAAAYAELDARFDADEGAEHPRAWAWATRFRRAFASRDWDALAALHAPDQEAHNHRLVGWGTLRGPGAWVPTLQQLVDLAADAQQRVDHLRLGERGLLWRFAWQGTREGGDFEAPMLLVVELDEAGRERRLDVWDPERLDTAFARFAEIEALAAPSGPFENEASRAWRAVMAAWQRRDAERFRALQPRPLRYRDHRRQFRLDLDREQFLEFTRPLISIATGAALQLLGTRGERLALLRFVLEAAEDAVGPSAIESLLLVETDERCEIAAYDRYDLDDEEAAWTELDARFDAGEAAAHPRALASIRASQRAFAARDWDSYAALVAPGFVQRDRRRLVWSNEGRDLAGFLDMVRSLPDLAPDTALRTDHLRLCERGSLRQLTQRGSHEGGAFESVIVIVQELDAQGRITSWETYDADPPDAALARFAEIENPAMPFANAATRDVERMQSCWRARDWAGYAECLAPSFRYSDRRPLVQLELDRARYVEFIRQLGDMDESRLALEPLATRGERLLLGRLRVEFAGGDVGTSDLESLSLYETDEHGAVVALVRFDAGDLDAAYAELDARYATGEGASAPAFVTTLGRSFAAGDWDALAALCAPDLVAEDHRLVSWGTLRGPAAWVETVRALSRLAGDARLRGDHVRIAGRFALLAAAWVGTREGGAFESPNIVVAEHDAAGKLLRLELYDPEKLDVARARFEELVARDGRERGAAGPFANLATRTVERGAARITARDWEGFRALFAPAFRFVDRTAIGKLESGGDAWLAAFREQVEMTSGPLVPHVLATRGERLALVRMLWRGAGGDVGESELDWLIVIEVDERGDHLGLVSFEPSDLAGAYRELDARFASSSIFAAVERTYAAAYRRDREACLAQFAPGWHADDHRRLGWGRTLDSAEMFFRAQQALLELAPDLRYRVDHFAVRGRAFLTQVAQVGTREGGPFESLFLYTGTVDEQGLLARYELYDIEEIAAARARFEALAAEAPAESPFANAATRVADRVIETWAAQDWELFGRNLPEGFRLSDRRRTVQLELDRDAARGFSRSLVEGGRSGRIRTELLATRGESLALLRWRVEVAGGDVGESEIRHLNLFEVDEQGALRRLLRWDDDALAAALAELEARFEAGEGAAHAGTLAAWRRWEHAIAIRDWDALAATRSPGFVFRDHRLLGWGTTMSDAASAAQITKVLVDLAPDVHRRHDHVRLCERGILEHLTSVGTRDGGAFEMVFLAVYEWDAQGRCRAIDNYDVDRFDLARARFEELTTPAHAEPPFANAAYRANQSLIRASDARDWASIESLAPSLVLDDRRRIVGVAASLGANLRFWFQVPGFWIEARLLATRGERLALHSTTFGGRVPEGGGEVEGEAHLDLVEVDGRGRVVANLLFDIADEATAFAELDARHAAIDRSTGGVWLRAFGSALERRDWDAVAALYAPDFVGSDHRLVSWGTLQGPVAFLESLRQMFALAPDARMRVDHVRTHERGVISECCWVGTREGGTFESVFVATIELAPDGTALRADFYDPQHLPRALRRFEEIRTAERRDPPAPFTKPNAASAWLDRFQPAFNARDWDALRARYAPDVSYEDRQRLSLVAGGIDTLWASMRERAEAGARLERFQLLGSAGDRVAIQRLLWAGGEAESRFEMEHIVVQEVNEAGRLVATINFDPGDARAAQREAWARWAALDPVAAPWIALLNEITDAWNAHDAARVRNTLADEFVVEDHRLAGIGRIEGADAYGDSISALWKLAPDQQIEFTRCCAISPHAVLLVLRRSGTLDGGGAFESDYTWLSVQRGGRVTRLELFEIENLDAALARFEALRPDPLAVPPNAASRAVDAQWASWQAEDWAALEALLAGGSYEDRRKLFKLSGGADLHLGDLRHLRTTGLAPARRLLATAGERLALEHMLWSVREEGAASEIELLRVTELGADGRIAAIVIFDPEARAAASDELFERWARQSDCWLPRGTIEFIRAWNRHDRAGLLAALPADYVFHDRRRTGIGRVEGAGPYVDSLIALWKLSPDVRLDFFSIVARDPHGFVGVGRWFGTNAEGGEFEALFLGVAETRGEQQVAVDLFEAEEMDAALARFEELSAQTAPSSSTRAR